MMSFLKKYPVLASVIALGILVFIGELVFLYLMRGNVAEAKNQYRSVESNRNSVLSLSPAPTEGNLKKAKENGASLSKALEKVIDSITAKEGQQYQVPESSSDFYFEIQDFIERYRDRAGKMVMREGAGEEEKFISLPDGLNFGFGHFVDEGKGPPKKHLQEVTIQFAALQFLLDTLFDAEPTALVEVSRDPISEEIDLSAREQKEEINLPPETFLIDPLETARVPGAIKTYAFRLVFRGYTESLRKFLNRLDSEASAATYVVRRVEANSAVFSSSNDNNNASSSSSQNQSDDFFSFMEEGQQSEDESAPPQQTTQEPIVENNLTRFVVIIERIEVLDQFKQTSLEKQSTENP